MTRFVCGVIVGLAIAYGLIILLGGDQDLELV